MRKPSFKINLDNFIKLYLEEYNHDFSKEGYSYSRNSRVGRGR